MWKSWRILCVCAIKLYKSGCRIYLWNREQNLTLNMSWKLYWNTWGRKQVHVNNYLHMVKHYIVTCHFSKDILCKVLNLRFAWKRCMFLFCSAVHTKPMHTMHQSAVVLRPGYNYTIYRPVLIAFQLFMLETSPTYVPKTGRKLNCHFKTENQTLALSC